VQKIFGVSLKIGVSVSKGVLGTAVEAAAPSVAAHDRDLP